jgi:hypothetical protein
VDPIPSDLEDLLRRSRPRPDPEFIRELEDSLMRSVRREPRGQSRVRPLRLQRLRLAVGSAAGLASLLLLLSIAGLHPLGMGGTQGADADRKCVTVSEWVLVRKPILVFGTHGPVTVVYRTEWATQPRIRCR